MDVVAGRLRNRITGERTLTHELIKLFKIARTLIKEPNLRLYLVQTAKDVKNMYYRYHV